MSMVIVLDSPNTAIADDVLYYQLCFASKAFQKLAQRLNVKPKSKDKGTQASSSPTSKENKT